MSDLAKSIHDQRESANPQLYRDLALYLQVVRQILPGAIDRAVFHLVSQGESPVYIQQTQERRDQFHERINTLVRRCLCLITVEQLVPLAAQMERERQRRRVESRRQLIDDLSSESPASDVAKDDPEGKPDDSDARRTLPRGSVSLGLSIPSGGGLFGWGNETAFRFGSGSGPDPGPDPDARLEAETMGGPQPETSDDDEDMANPQEPDDSSLASPSLPLTPLGLFPLASAAQGHGSALHSEAPGLSDGANPSPFSDHRLPRDPVLLLGWLEGMEQALARRLRNLSHALNVELLRLGVCRALLPVSLLDAVLHGQIELLSAPANLLRLPLPFSLADNSSSSVAMALLLRGSDLEMEEPRLRTCRHRLQRHRQEVIKMAHHYRRLQRRLKGREAERLWLQDLHRNRPVLE